MKFQDSSFNGLKVTVGTESVTHPRTNGRSKVGGIIMQPILSTIFDISSFKPSSVAVPGAVQPCLYRTRLQPRIQVFS